LPIAGEPADVYSTLEKAHRALAHSTYPKLLFTGNPGVLVSTTFVESFTKGLKNCRVVQLGAGRHYLQEDHAEVIGTTVNQWLSNLGVGSSPKHKVASWAFPSDESTSVFIFLPAQAIGMAWCLRSCYAARGRKSLYPEGGVAQDAVIFR